MKLSKRGIIYFLRKNGFSVSEYFRSGQVRGSGFRTSGYDVFEGPKFITVKWFEDYGSSSDKIRFAHLQKLKTELLALGVTSVEYLPETKGAVARLVINK